MNNLPSECLFEVLKWVHMGTSSNEWLLNVVQACRLFSDVMKEPFAWKDIPVVFPFSKTCGYDSSNTKDKCSLTRAAALLGSKHITVRADVWDHFYLKHNWDHVSSVRVVIKTTHGCENAMLLLSLTSVPEVELVSEGSAVTFQSGWLGGSFPRLPESANSVMSRMAPQTHDVTLGTRDMVCLRIRNDVVSWITTADSYNQITSLMLRNMCRYKYVMIENGEMNLSEPMVKTTVTTIAGWATERTSCMNTSAICAEKADTVATMLYAMIAKTAQVHYMSGSNLQTVHTLLHEVMQGARAQDRAMNIHLTIDMCSAPDLVCLLSCLYALSPLLVSLTLTVNHVRRDVLESAHLNSSEQILKKMNGVEFPDVRVNFNIAPPQ